MMIMIKFFQFDLSCPAGSSGPNGDSAACSVLSYFQQTARECSNRHFVCDTPDQNISAWFGGVAMLMMLQCYNVAVLQCCNEICCGNVAICCNAAMLQ